MLQCGVCELDITPSLGSTIPGYFNDRKSTGIIDRLYAKALVVENDGSAVAFVVLDTIKVRKDVAENVRRRVGETTGILPERVMISATHTHTGPAVATTTFLSADESYLEWLAVKAADAVAIAYNGRREARIGFGAGHETDIAFNRRYFMKDGTLRTNPGIGNPDVDRPAGPIDPEVGVVRIDDADGRPMAVVTNYAVHTDTVGGTEYCADFPGELSVALKKALGEQTVSLFMMGASGNINHYDVLHGKLEYYAKPQSRHYMKMGRILAGEVLKVREKIFTSSEARVEERKAFVKLRYRQPTPEQIAEAQANLTGYPEGHVERNFAKELLEAARLGEGTAEAEIQTVAVGDLAVVGLPAEMFVEFGLEIKGGSPFGLTLINELCNGIVGTYVCTREAYRLGGYEPRITSNNRLQEDAGELFVDCALGLLRELKPE
ncbi:neutral/alkaline non-lysosomal ceramidase N-terminal domain-containing protein [Paenibacillus hodogayensis]|uniref:Neutral/alkaline non-lysosomal ceramidase N-terminal domain-containing protein n=1 Tax=Paenibacillus hodogayensis TaxID=279208 RepID=A0ABV5VTZ4_9BACL